MADSSSDESSPPRSIAERGDGILDVPSPEEKNKPAGTRVPDEGDEGLTVLWQADPPQNADPNALGMIPNSDIVMVHGLHGTGRSPWHNPGSGDSGWLEKMGQVDGRKVMSFGYDGRRMLSGQRTRQAIRTIATSLLEKLTAERIDSKGTRIIAFIAHDIGGIIVKDALVLASLDPKSYGDIIDFSRVLVFYGCPHRSLDLLDMEDRLARLVVNHSRQNVPRVSGVVASIRGLADSVTEINHSFTESKHSYRSHIISLYASNKQSTIDQAFDSLSGTLGVPFEKRFAGGAALSSEGAGTEKDDGGKIEAYLKSIGERVAVYPAHLENERHLMFSSPAVPLLTTADSVDHPFSWIGENETYKSWLSQRGPQLLYFYGTVDSRAAAEYIFYALDRRSNPQEKDKVVLYFTFDRRDVRRDSIQDMIASFLAQIIGHYPIYAEISKADFEQLKLDRSWNDLALLDLFSHLHPGPVSFVINNFEECEEVSRKAFLQLFSHAASQYERLWRVAVTSREPGALDGDLLGMECSVLDLDRSSPSPESATSHDAPLRREVSSIFTRRPELRGIKESLEEGAHGLGTIDPLACRLLLEQSFQNEDWPLKASTESIDGTSNVISLDAMVDMVLSSAMRFPLARRAISWILYSKRPLSVWELSTALFIGSENDDSESAAPSPQFIQSTVSRIMSWFAGIIVLDHHEFRIRHPRVWKLVSEAKVGEYSECLEQGNASWLIAKTCLSYLAREEVRHVIEASYGESRSVGMDLPIFSSSTTLCGYAIQHLADHLSLTPARYPLDDLINSFVKSGASATLCTGYWALSQPFSRSQKPFRSLYPLLAGLGLSEAVGSLPNGDEDLSNGLVEACLNGSAAIVRKLLNHIKYKASDVQEAVIAAGSTGDEEKWLDVINYANNNYEDFPWPESLLGRAALLGLEKVVSRLLDLGCPVDPKDPNINAAPLYLAARNGHVEVTRLLLKHKADVKRMTGDGGLSVHAAVMSGHAAVVRVLVEEGGAEVDMKDKNGLTAVYIGSLRGSWKVVHTLLELKADPNLGNKDDDSELTWNPLLVAALDGHIECARALLRAKADVNIRGEMGTPLRHAAANGFLDLTRLLLEHGADPLSKAITPPILVQAISGRGGSDRLNIVKALVEHGAIIDSKTDTKWTPLMVACGMEGEEMAAVASYLLDHGADIEHKSVDKVTALDIVAKNGNTNMARLLLAKGARPNPAVPGEHAPMHFAASTGQVDVIKVLLEYQAKIDWSWSPKINDTFTPLAIAVTHEKADVVRLLGDAGADVNHDQSRGLPVLFYAMSTKILGALLEFRPDFNRENKFDGDDLLFAIMTRRSSTVENIQLMLRAGANINKQNKNGVTLLARALDLGSREIARFLVSKGADINLSSEQHGGALHVVCEQRDTDMIQLLVEAGADVNFPAAGPRGTPLMAAIITSPDSDEEEEALRVSMENVQYLLDNHADMNKQGGQFGSPLSAAAWQGSLSLITLLLRNGANVGAADPMGRIPIHFAALRGADRFELLLEAESDIFAQDETGRTVLHWAVQGGQVRVVNRILELAGDKMVNHCDKDGWTPLCWAARGGETFWRPPSAENIVAVIKVLLKNGADVNVGCSMAGRDWTPLSIARYYSLGPEVIELLTSAHSAKRGEQHDGEGDKTTQRRLNVAPGTYCDYCLFRGLGLRYLCEQCENFMFCHKCYHLREAIHPPSHTWKEVGQEFDEVPPEPHETASGEDTDTESDDSENYDDSQEGEEESQDGEADADE